VGLVEAELPFIDLGFALRSDLEAIQVLVQQQRYILATSLGRRDSWRFSGATTNACLEVVE
jgi:hypothetical protein